VYCPAASRTGLTAHGPRCIGAMAVTVRLFNGKIAGLKAPTPSNENSYTLNKSSYNHSIKAPIPSMAMKVSPHRNALKRNRCARGRTGCQFWSIGCSGGGEKRCLIACVFLGRFAGSSPTCLLAEVRDAQSSRATPSIG